MLRTRSIARASAVKIELSIGIGFLRTVFVQNSRARCPTIVLRSIRKDIEVIGVVMKNIVKFLLIKSFGDITEHMSYNCYHRHFHVPSFFQFSSKIYVLISLLAFF